MHYRLVYSLVLLVFNFSIATAQPFPQLRFQHLDEKDGLSSRRVTAITEDMNGFIWLGTVNGLNRYDGYRFKTFFHAEDDSSTLPNNNISGIHSYDNARLWISTKNGLALLNTHTYKCRNIMHRDNDNASLRKDEDVQPYAEKGKQVLLSTYEGLYRLNNDFSVTEIEQPIVPFSFYSEYRKYCYGLFPDRKGGLWSFVGNRIYQLDNASKKVVGMFIAPESYHITKLYFDEDNTCWITTWGGSGLIKFNTATHEFNRIKINDASLICSQVSEWKTRGKKYIVVATLGYGIYFIDPVTMKFKNYFADEYGKKILSSHHVNCIWIDKLNNLWLGTDNGVDYITASASLFDIIPVYLNKTDGMHPENEGRIVKNIFKTKEGTWIGKWHDGGTALYDSNWVCKKYFKSLVGSSVKNNFTSQSYGTLQWKDELYFSTDSGIVQMNTTTWRTRLFHPAGAKYSVDVRNIIVLNDSTWWVRSHGSGIYVFNPVSGKFIKHYAGNDSCSQCLPVTHYEYLMKSSKGVLWLATEAGLYKYQPETDNFTAWRRTSSDALTFPSNKLSGMAEDSDGNLWIGTEAGICMFDPADGKVKKIFRENTNISIVFRVCLDEYQNVWFNSQTGIWCWIRSEDKLVKFGIAEGIPDGYELGILEKGTDGNIYAGCTDALACFRPQVLMNSIKHTCNALITDAIIENKQAEVDYGAEKKITLQPGEKTFSIDFTVLNYDLPANNQYYYRLLPHSPEWTANNTGHLSFYNLSPGTHILEVKGKNRLGDNFGTPDYILVKIKPYWYQTTAFKLLVFVLIGTLVLLLYRWRIRQVKKQAAVKQKMIETEMQALRAQMNPHFIFNSLNSIENFIMKNEKRLASDYLNKFARLVRMILDSSRNEMVPLARDMEALQLYVDLELLRFNNKFIYETFIDPALINGDYKVPSLVIQPYVENAIVHGLAHSEKEKLVLNVMVALEQGAIKYTVQDNGVGRAAAAAYNLQNKPLHKSVGLKITEDRINIFNGSGLNSSTVKFSDLYSNNGEPSGTKVEITIKVK